ncbi:TPA: hypothetical protein DCQ44_02245, partial [Candidatus Taylorbacteria bacterium]|nr:hypothetical protein [Candidatus Taylorbacteria bacterium]
MRPDEHPEDTLENIERAVRLIDGILATARGSETIALPTQELVDIINSLSKLFSTYDNMVKMCSTIGMMNEEEILNALEEAEAIIAAKYEHDRDERITLAAAVLHLVDGEPTEKSRALARKLARSVITSFDDDEKIIDEPVDSDYFRSLAEEHLLTNTQVKGFGKES